MMEMEARVAAAMRARDYRTTLKGGHADQVDMARAIRKDAECLKIRIPYCCGRRREFRSSWEHHCGPLRVMASQLIAIPSPKL
jgi:hypothetical protein